METQLDTTVAIEVLEPLRRVNAALLELLDGFSREDWARQTVHRDRDVKDVTAHLLHGTLRRVSSMRDRYRPTTAPRFESAQELVDFIQSDNRRFMDGMRLVSPELLRELIARFDPLLVELLGARAPLADGLGVVWAGEWVSRHWFDVAREYTEKWHHQQQLRDATGAAPLYAPELFVPVLETFARGLPYAFRGCEAAVGAAIVVVVSEPTLAWTLRREANAWSLWGGGDEDAGARVEMSADLAWRLWTKGIAKDEARERVRVVGDERYAEPLLSFVAIMA